MRPLEILLLVLVLSGCAHSGATGPCANPAPGVRYCLLPPNALPADGEPRLVHVTGNELDQHMISQVNVDTARLTMIATNLLGQPLFEIRYKNSASGPTVSVFPADAPMEAAWLLALLQIAEADADEVRSGLRGSVLIEEGHSRRIERNGETLVWIDKRNGRTEIHIPRQQFRINIRTLTTHQ
ncbi:MAG: DUF3261 domain-containing protein [Proteobacteria bacterium]|nr:DUF3261 domain-containing protein [Pseudomonadota bacterium]